MKALLIALIVLNSFFAMTQKLVPNFNFETISSSPTTFNQIGLTSNWYSPYGVADVFHTSASSSSVGVPANYFGTQSAHSGNTYVGIANSSTNSYHEYLEVALTTPLVVGQDYYCEAYVSPGEGNYKYGTNNFGFRFTVGALTGAAGNPPIGGPVDVNWTSTILDYTNWVRISGTFTATTAGTHLTIGNFFSSSATTWTLLGTSGGINSQYWYIDDVTVQPTSSLALPGISLSAGIFSNSSVALQWNFNDTDDSEYSIERSTDGGISWTAITKVFATQSLAQSSYIDKPGTSGEIIYVMRKISDNGDVLFSEKQIIILENQDLQELFSVSPNPLETGGECSINLAAGSGSVQWRLMDPSGGVISSGDVDESQIHFTLNTDALNPGVYLLTVSNSVESSTQKIVVR